MHTLTRWAAAGLGVAALVASAPAARAETVRANIDDFAFTPDPIIIEVGDRVVWTNRGDETHTVTADDGSFEDDDVDPDESYDETFREPGRFAYRCTRHDGMTGVVEVHEETVSLPLPGTSETTSTTERPRRDTTTTTTTAQPAPAPPSTSPPATGSPAAPGSATTRAPSPATTVTTRALRVSTTSTSAPPPAQETVTTGAPPVFTPTPDELAGATPAEAGSRPADGSVVAPNPPVGDDAVAGWVYPVAVMVAAAGAAGLLRVRRSRSRGRAAGTLSP